MNRLALFNPRSGVGKSTLIYHLAWMYAEMGSRVLVVDLDPQADLTRMFMGEPETESLVASNSDSQAMSGFVVSFLGDDFEPDPVNLVHISDAIALVPGDSALMAADESLGIGWTLARSGSELTIQSLLGIHQAISSAETRFKPDITLVDLGPNLGGLNRMALISVDQFLIPVQPDLYAMQSMELLGSALARWRGEWSEFKVRLGDAWTREAPDGVIASIGYVILQQPVQDSELWMNRISDAYSSELIPRGIAESLNSMPLAVLKNYRSLIPLSQQAHRPMFLLRAADGAIGGHAAAVESCYQDFQHLVHSIELARHRSARFLQD